MRTDQQNGSGLQSKTRVNKLDTVNIYKENPTFVLPAAGMQVTFRFYSCTNLQRNLQIGSVRLVFFIQFQPNLEQPARNRRPVPRRPKDANFFPV